MLCLDIDTDGEIEPATTRLSLIRKREDLGCGHLVRIITSPPSSHMPCSSSVEVRTTRKESIVAPMATAANKIINSSEVLVPETRE